MKAEPTMIYVGCYYSFSPHPDYNNRPKNVLIETFLHKLGQNLGYRDIYLKGSTLCNEHGQDLVTVSVLKEDGQYKLSLLKFNSVIDRDELNTGIDSALIHINKNTPMVEISGLLH